MSDNIQESGYKPVQLGKPGRPYPMTHREIKGGAVTSELGVIEDPQLQLHSQRQQSEVLGLAFRNMPTPGMLPVFKKALELRAPDGRRRVQCVLGEAGAGKSFLAELIGNMRDPRGPIVVDCGKKRNLNELFFETVIDMDSSKALIDQIDERLREGTLKSASVALLKKLDKGFSQEGKRVSMDWEAAADADAAAMTSIVNQVRTIEGLDKADGTQLGLKTREGALIRAWKENREIILDEYNKSEPGSDAGLQLFWQLMTGEIDKYVANGGTGQSFTFHRKDMKPGFFVTLTGNLSKDGTTTRQLDTSAYQRLRPVTIDPPTEADYQHRWCQARTGVPITTLYHIGEESWKANPDHFTQFLHDVRRLGLSEEDQAKIPSHQLERLDNWQNEMQAAERGAKFYHGLAVMLDPNSEMHRSGKNPDLAAEVDDHFNRMVGVGLRMMLDHIQQSDNVVAKSMPRSKSGGFSRDAFSDGDTAVAVAEDVNLNNGTRFCDHVLGELFDHTTEKPHTRTHIMAHAANNGLCEAKLTGAKKSDVKLMSELMNIDVMKGQSVSRQAPLVRDFLCDLLRARYDGMPEKNEDMISTAQVERMLIEAKKAGKEPMSAHASSAFVANMDVNSLRQQPFIQVVTHDATPTGGESWMRLDPAKLADHDGLMMALAVPVMREKNLPALWNKALISAGEQGAQYTGDAACDEPLRIAMMDEPKSKFAITTVMCKKEGKDGAKEVPVHVLRDIAADRTLVVGQQLDPKIAKLLERTGVTYIDATKPRAEKAIDAVLKDMLSGKSSDVSEDLSMAFMMRNTRSDGAVTGNNTLAELLSNKVTQCSVPNYVTGLEKVEQVSHAAREFAKASETARKGKTK